MKSKASASECVAMASEGMVCTKQTDIRMRNQLRHARNRKQRESSSSSNGRDY
jgi:hypothetical protein